MTVVMEDREQLAGPRRLDFLRPTALRHPIRPVTRLALLTTEEPDEQDPFHLVQARELAERHAGSPTAWARLAQAELIAGNRDAAVGAAQTSLKQMRSADASGALAAAVVLIECGRARDAESALATIDVTSGPLISFRAALAAGRGDIETALDLVSNDSSPEADNLRAWIRLEQGNFPETIRWYRRAIWKAGPTPSALTNMGYAHAALGQRERAIRDTLQALELNPSHRSRVGLNLVTYYLFDGDSTEALKVLRSLQDDAPRDIELWFAEARLRLSTNEPDGALRALRRVRTKLWAHLSTEHQAELTANIAFVEWHLGRLSRLEAATQILRELERIDFVSLRITDMLPSLLTRFSEAELLRRVLMRTHQAHPEAALFELEVHTAVLEHRFSDAIDRAIEWTDDSPLDSSAATAATYLLADVAGEHGRAVEIGLPALRRMPTANALANNVAYALALAGRAREAQGLVPDDISPQSTATRALIALRLGDEAEAIRLYRLAFDRATKKDDPDLPALVIIHADMAMRCFSSKGTSESLDLPEIEVSGAWSDEPRFAIALEMLNGAGLEAPAVLQS